MLIRIVLCASLLFLLSSCATPKEKLASDEKEVQMGIIVYKIHCSMGHIDSIDVVSTGPVLDVLPIHDLQSRCDTKDRT